MREGGLPIESWIDCGGEMNLPRPSPHDGNLSLTSDRDAVREHDEARGRDQERFSVAPERTPEATYSHQANVAEAFESLGKWFARLETQFNEVVTGTEMQRMLCSRRFPVETHDLANAAATEMKYFKVRAFELSEAYKEKCQ